jgi:hypothetical protein
LVIGRTQSSVSGAQSLTGSASLRFGQQSAA